MIESRLQSRVAGFALTSCRYGEPAKRFVLCVSEQGARVSGDMFDSRVRTMTLARGIMAPRRGISTIGAAISGSLKHPANETAPALRKILLVSLGAWTKVRH